MLRGILGVTDVLLPHIDGLELADHLAGPVLAKPFGPVAFLEQVGRMLTAVQQG